MVLALPACRGAPARSLREASACGPRDACVFDALKRSGDRKRVIQHRFNVLNGHRCDRHVDVGDADAAGAVARVGALGFVGVADDWATSVCLFHRVYNCRRGARSSRSRRRRATRRTTGPTGPSTRPRGAASPSCWTRRARRRPARTLARGGGGAAAARAARDAAAVAAAPAARPVPRRAPYAPFAPSKRWAFSRDGALAARRDQRASTPRGDVGDAAPPAARERSGAFWRGTVHAFTGYSVEEMVARRAYVHNLASRLDGRGNVVDALAEPVAASLQFSGGEGNARRWAVTTACDAGDDRLDVAAAEVAVEVEASARRTEPSPATRRRGARRRAADGPTGITLRNYGFADHGDVCAKEAFLYLDGISTSNGLKYYGACAPVILDAGARRDLVTRPGRPTRPRRTTRRDPARQSDAAVRAHAELQVLLLEDRDADAIELRRLFSPAAAADGLYPRSGACAAFPRPAAAAGVRAPVVVAGQGGSGSRSVVELLRACGVEMNGVDGGEDDASSADRRLRARACALDTPQNP
ncbi:hypothetical protein JL722_12779 [Aureococcus anophagefferens]|nr:hypothetical protein JL722_12779 [Aureococcus anophagefferens]